MFCQSLSFENTQDLYNRLFFLAGDFSEIEGDRTNNLFSDLVDIFEGVEKVMKSPYWSIKSIFHEVTVKGQNKLDVFHLRKDSIVEVSVSDHQERSLRVRIPWAIQQSSIPIVNFYIFHLAGVRDNCLGFVPTANDCFSQFFWFVSWI